MQDRENMTAYDKFIQSFRNKNTQRIYGRGITMFSEWYGKSVDEILNERNQDLIEARESKSPIEQKEKTDNYERLLESYWNDLVSAKFPKDAKEPYKEDSASSLCKGILQLFRFYGIGFRLRSGSPIASGFKVRAKMRFPLKTEHIRKMFWRTRDLQVKTWLSMANDLGWRIGDFLSIQVKELPNLDQQTPVEWFRVTAKEKVVAKTCISDDSARLLKEYIHIYDKKPDDVLFDVDENTINRTLRQLANECDIQIEPYSLSFHCFRDYIISNAKNQQIDPDIVKLMVGKTVKQDMLPYLSGIDVRQSFAKLQETTKINGEVLKAQVNDLLTQQGMMIQALTIRIENLETQLKETQQKHFARLNEWLTKYQPLLEKLARQTQ